MGTIIDLISKPWLGSILGVLGLAAAVLFYLRSRKVSRLAFQHDVITLVGASDAAFPDEVEIRFSGDIVPRVTADRIVLWNDGNTTLGASQMVESDPLRAELKEDSSLLKVSALKCSREVNGCSVGRRKDSQRIADIHFDFLDPGDGIAFEILHSGSPIDLKILGTLRGMPSGIKNYGRARWFADRRTKRLPFPFGRLVFRLPFFLVIVLGFLMAAYGLFKPQVISVVPSLAKTSQPSDTTKPDWFFVLTGILYAAMPLALLWFRRRRYPASLEVELPEQDSETHKKTEPG
jgi:hypothetical protein